MPLAPITRSTVQSPGLPARSSRRTIRSLLPVGRQPLGDGAGLVEDRRDEPLHRGEVGLGDLALVDGALDQVERAGHPGGATRPERGGQHDRHQRDADGDEADDQQNESHHHTFTSTTLRIQNMPIPSEISPAMIMAMPRGRVHSSSMYSRLVFIV